VKKRNNDYPHVGVATVFLVIVRPISSLGSPAISMIHGRRQVHQSSFSRGSSIAPDAKTAIFIESAGEPKFRAIFDHVDGATGEGQVEGTEACARANAARRAVKCAE
jgi:hypothetical protein